MMEIKFRARRDATAAVSRLGTAGRSTDRYNYFSALMHIFHKSLLIRLPSRLQLPPLHC